MIPVGFRTDAIAEDPAGRPHLKFLAVTRGIVRVASGRFWNVNY
jgi:hypothetical protein